MTVMQGYINHVILTSSRKGSANRAKCKKKTVFSFCIPEMPPTLAEGNGSANRAKSKMNDEVFHFCSSEVQPTLAEGKLQKQAYANLHVSCLTRQVLRHKSAIYGIFLSQNHCLNGCLEKKICNNLCKFAIRLQICMDCDARGMSPHKTQGATTLAGRALCLLWRN